MMGDIRVPSVRECMYKDIFFRNCVAIVGELGAEKLNGVLKLRCGCVDGPAMPSMKARNALRSKWVGLMGDGDDAE